MKLTAIVLTHNNEAILKRSLDSLKFADEVIVVDDNSTDGTLQIAKSLGAKTSVHDLHNDWAQQRNFALTKANGEWVLFLDSDEVVSGELEKEISARLKNPQDSVQGFFLKRYDSFFGRELRFGETGNVRLLRLAKRNVGKWENAVHEVWKIAGEVAFLKNPILHYPHQTLLEFGLDIDRYSSLAAKEFAKTRRFASWQTIVLPIGKFISNFLFKLGFLDGFPGFTVAFMMSLHSLIVRIKQYELLAPRGLEER